jgi:hypothetical protein
MIKVNDDGGQNLIIWENKIKVSDSIIPCEIKEITPKIVSDFIKTIK